MKRAIRIIGQALSGVAAVLAFMMQVAPHDAPITLCKWFSSSPSCPDVLFSPWVLRTAAALVLVTLLLFAWPTARRYLKLFGSTFRFVWPIQRRQGWPHSAPLSVKIPHIRTYVYPELEDSSIRVALVFFNSSMHTLILESVDGHLWHSGPNDAKNSISWINSQPPLRVDPYQNLEVSVRQHLSPEEIRTFRELTEPGRRLSLEFHLRIRAKAEDTGEVVQLGTWDGIVCERPTDALLVSRMVSLHASVGIATGSTGVKR